MSRSSWLSRAPSNAIPLPRMDNPHTPSPARLAALREAVERADMLASVQARLIDNQARVIELLETRVKTLESMVAELKANY